MSVNATKVDPAPVENLRTRNTDGNTPAGTKKRPKEQKVIGGGTYSGTDCIITVDPSQYTFGG